MSDTARIVLVKPGDVLIFGNVSVDMDATVFTETMTTLKEQLGLAHILVFEDDIDLAVQQSSGTGHVANPRPGHPNEWCVKCGQARGVQDEDGTVDWLARWQAPRDCDHELPAGTTQ